MEDAASITITTVKVSAGISREHSSLSDDYELVRHVCIAGVDHQSHQLID
jgi:hypothetical protein